MTVIGAFRRRVIRARVRLYVERGSRHCKQARYAEAERDLWQALDLAERVFGPQSPELIGPLNQIGVLYKYWGRFEEAEPLYFRALALARAAKDQAAIATLQHNLGGLYHARGAYEQAEMYARAAVAIRIGLRGANELEVAADEAALAAILDAESKTVEAEQLLRRALETFERRLGSGHYEVAATLNNLAAVLGRSGALDAAEPLYRRALAIKRRLLSNEHPEVAVILNNLAVLELERGTRAEALALVRRAQRIAAASLPTAHPTRQACEANVEKIAAWPTGVDVQPH